MEIPSGGLDLAIVVAAALPGIVYAAARTRALGHRAPEASISARVAQGLIAAIILNLLYLVILGPKLFEWVAIDDYSDPATLRTLALVALGLGVVFPSGCAWVLSRGSRWIPPAEGRIAEFLHDRRASKLGRRKKIYGHVGRVTTRFGKDLTAWDYAAWRVGRTFVRIKKLDGVYLGGWFGDDSYVSTHPEPPEIYVERQHFMSAKGVWSRDPMPGTEGFWYMIQPGDIVEWCYPEAPNEDETETSND
jgi:hypothetical protein